MELFLCVLKWSLAVGAAALVLHLLRPALDRRCRARRRTWTWPVLACALILGPGAERLLSTRPAAPRTAPALPPSMEALLPALWLGGAAVFLLWRLLGTLLFCRRVRRWGCQPSDSVRQVYGDACADLGIHRPPVLLISAPAGSPMMMGLLRPRLCLPSEDWSPRELAFILRHELTHCRRHDLWYKLLLLLANALHWFNPLVYLLSREADTDLELACDDAVVAGCGQADRQAYSETLLGSLHRQKGLSAAALSTHFYGGAAVMRDRFRNILAQSRRTFGAPARREAAADLPPDE